MKRSLFHIVPLMVMVLLLSCKKGIWSDAGPMKAETRETQPFTQILLYDNVHLVLTQDTVERVRVEAPEKLLSEVTTEMNGHSLTIRNRNRSLLLPPGERLTVYASVKNLARIDYLGAGNIECTNTLQIPYFTVLASDGSGDLHLKVNSILTDAFLYSDMADFRFEGSSDTCYTYSNTLGTIDYRDFVVRRLNMDYSGRRHAYVHATELLRGRIFYQGNVYYKGQPFLQKQETSSGRFLPF